jgi:hypothetical protein
MNSTGPKLAQVIPKTGKTRLRAHPWWTVCTEVLKGLNN